MAETPEPPIWTAGLTDADLHGTMLGAVRLVGMLALVVLALFWWRAGWQSAVLVAVGAGISAASLWAADDGDERAHGWGTDEPSDGRHSCRFPAADRRHARGALW